MQVLAASFTQHYTPVADNILLSALVAALPIVVLLGLLGLFRVKAHLAALAGLAASLLVAIVVFGMPVTTAAAAATNGAAFGLSPSAGSCSARSSSTTSPSRPASSRRSATPSPG